MYHDHQIPEERQIARLESSGEFSEHKQAIQAFTAGLDTLFSDWPSIADLFSQRKDFTLVLNLAKGTIRRLEDVRSLPFPWPATGDVATDIAISGMA